MHSALVEARRRGLVRPGHPVARTKGGIRRVAQPYRCSKGFVPCSLAVWMSDVNTSLILAPRFERLNSELRRWQIAIYKAFSQLLFSSGAPALAQEQGQLLPPARRGLRGTCEGVVVESPSDGAAVGCNTWPERVVVAGLQVRVDAHNIDDVGLRRAKVMPLVLKGASLRHSS